ncbi:MAG: amidohydrolase [Gammaproteobacteria bacterium]|nr:amidohydrolase [Gammaproteobacteria bacterium]
MKFVSLLITLFVLLGCSFEPPPWAGTPVAADLILTNGRIYTLTWPDPLPSGGLAGSAPHEQGWEPDAQALAIKDGEIIFVGSHPQAAAWRGEHTRAIDLDGATVIPGLVDSHTHVFQLGLALNRVDLFSVDTEAQAVARAVERAKTVPVGEWIIGQGWDEGAWANHYPDKSLLSEAVPDHPVFMRSLHSFAGWVNQAALDRLGLSEHSKVSSGGEMRLGADGKPSGLFLNNAVDLIEAGIPALSSEQLVDNVLAGLERMAVDGFVGVHDAGLNAAEMAVLEQLEASGRLPIRVYAMLSVREEELARQWLQRGPDQDADSMLVTRSVKAYYDGALGSRGARLLEDYSDKPGHRGVSGDDYGFDEELTAQMMQAGFQVGIHAIGDAGNRETLGFFRRVMEEHPQTAKGRHRIEHAQVIQAADLTKFGEHRVVASMQPVHAIEDKAWAEDRLGRDRMEGAYAWRTLRQMGTMLIFGSDNPGSDHSIFYGLHSVVTRKDKAGQPHFGWYPQQRLNMDEAIRAYTRWPAFASFREKYTGVIKPGRWADLTVMDIDPFVLSETDPEALLQGEILMTVVNGKIVHTVH